MILAKCKSCKNRNTENCPLKKKDAKAQKSDVECFEDEEIKSYGFGKKTEEKILSENAIKLLGLTF